MAKIEPLRPENETVDLIIGFLLGSTLSLAFIYLWLAPAWVTILLAVPVTAYILNSVRGNDDR